MPVAREIAENMADIVAAQKRANTVGLTLLSLKQPVCKVGPCLASGNLALRVFSLNSYLIRTRLHVDSSCCIPAFLVGVWIFATFCAEYAYMTNLQ